MHSISLRTQIGDDGTLRLEIPVGHTNTELEVMVIIQPVSEAGRSASGWPEGFFEQTAGSLAESPVTRKDQGDYEKREPLR
jgi:hypothetical protein